MNGIQKFPDRGPDCTTFAPYEGKFEKPYRFLGDNS
jgi:hypothetical protein